MFCIPPRSYPHQACLQERCRRTHHRIVKRSGQCEACGQTQFSTLEGFIELSSYKVCSNAKTFKYDPSQMGMESVSYVGKIDHYTAAYRNLFFQYAPNVHNDLQPQWCCFHWTISYHLGLYAFFVVVFILKYESSSELPVLDEW